MSVCPNEAPSYTIYTSEILISLSHFEPTYKLHFGTTSKQVAKIVNPFYKIRWFYYLHLPNPQWGFSCTQNIHDYLEIIA